MKYNQFTTDFLDRVSPERKDDKWIKEQFYNNSAKFIPVKDQKLLCKSADIPESLFLSLADFRDADAVCESSVFLGIINRSSYFAVDADAINIDTIKKENTDFIDIWPVMSLMDGRECALLVLARFMVYWNSRNKFCGKCGGITRSAEGGNVRMCADNSCGQNYFPTMDPAIIVLVESNNSCLLGRQKKWPKGLYSTLAGFVEPGESIESAVVREVMEESGVLVSEVEYHHSQPWLFPASLMLGFYAKAEDCRTKVNEQEMDDAKWFTRDEIKHNLENGLMLLPPGISISYRLIEEWFDAGGLKLRDVKMK